jgi:hypothetical protein
METTDDGDNELQLGSSESASPVDASEKEDIHIKVVRPVWTQIPANDPGGTRVLAIDGQDGKRVWQAENITLDEAKCTKY